MDGGRDESVRREPSVRASVPGPAWGPVPSSAPPAELAGATSSAGPAAAPAVPRGRHAGVSPVAATNWLREPGLALVFGALAFAVVGSVALALGWVALLLVIAFVQVFLARAWTDYLELPGAVPAAAGIVAISAVADVGVIVARLFGDTGTRANELAQLAPALGIVFVTAVLVQLARRDGRSGTLAGLVAVTTGGVLAIGAAVWLPLEASPSGVRWVSVGFALVASIGVVIGGAAWMRQSRVPGPALLLPVLIALLAGPFYVLGRIVSG